MGWKTKESGFASQHRQEIFLFSTASRMALGSTQSSIQCVLRLKRLGCEVDHSPPSSSWIFTSIPLYIFMAWCLIKYRDKFIFFFFTKPILIAPDEDLYSMQQFHMFNSQTEAEE
jgi:hypothetical protein